MGTDRFLWSVSDFRKRAVLRKGRRKWGLTGSYGLYPIFARRGERKRLVRILALS